MQICFPLPNSGSVQLPRSPALLAKVTTFVSKFISIEAPLHPVVVWVPLHDAQFALPVRLLQKFSPHPVHPYTSVMYGEQV